MLDPHSSWPKISSCLFADNMTNVTYFGAAPQSSSSSSSNSTSNAASSSNQDQLKGIVMYANMSLPPGAPSFYWEIELCSLGDSGGQEEGRHVGMGLSPKPSIPEGGSPPVSFTFVKDTCLVRRCVSLCTCVCGCVRCDLSVRLLYYTCMLCYTCVVLGRQFNMLERVYWTGRVFVFQRIL